MIREMAEAGMIEPSNSPWAAPDLLVKKKDDTWRFCVDYRHLNDVTRKDSYPLPRIDDALDKVAGSQWFSSLDLRSGYWQVELAPDARPKTAFTIGQGLWQFRVMPFGLCNAPASCIAVEAFKHFRPYLYGQRFLLRTDHASLTWLLSFKEPEGQVARWFEALQDFKIVVL